MTDQAISPLRRCIQLRLLCRCETSTKPLICLVLSLGTILKATFCPSLMASLTYIKRLSRLSSTIQPVGLGASHADQVSSVRTFASFFPF